MRHETVFCILFLLVKGIAGALFVLDGKLQKGVNLPTGQCIIKIAKSFSASYCFDSSKSQ